MIEKQRGRVASFACFGAAILAAWAALEPTGARAESTVVTVPLMRYGLGMLECAAYSPNPDAPLVATGGGIGVVLWDAETGSHARILSAPRHYVFSVAVSPDGTKILTGSWDNTAMLWDTGTGSVIRAFVGHSDSVDSVAFSPDGTKALTGSGDMTAKIWDVATGAEIQTFAGHTDRVRSVAFSLDGAKVLTGSFDKTAKLWNATNGVEIRAFSGHTGCVRSVAFSPDGTQALTGSEDTTAKLWNAATGAEIRTFSGHTDWIYCVAFSPDGTKILTGSDDATAKVWNAATGDEIRTVAGHTSRVGSVAFSPHGANILTASYDATARLWNAATGDFIRTFSGHTSGVSSVVFSPDETQVLTGSWDNTAKIMDAATGTSVRTFTGHESGLSSAAFSHDGTKALTGSWDSTARLWNVATGAEIRTFSGHTNGVSSVAFSPDGTQALTGSSDCTAKLWDAATGAEIRTFSGHTAEVYSVVFSPDGTKILTGSADMTAKSWDLATGAEIRTFAGHANCVDSVAFSPDGTKALTGSWDNTAKLWDAATGAEVRTFSGHESAVFSVAFSPDGTGILTGSADSTSKIWDAATGAEIRTFSSHKSGVASIALSRDGTRILTGGDDGLTLLWDSGLTSQTAGGPPPDPSVRKRDRMILVAGGGDYAGNPIAGQTKALANLAHLTATVRGYKTEDIYYLSAFETHSQNPNVDGAASADAITSATRNWASDASRLTIMLIDHGDKDLSIPEWYFLVDGTKSPRDYLVASELDVALDEVQSGGDPLREIALCVDACYAGGFIRKCSGAPQGTKRLVIASTTDTRLANFGCDDGAISFTYFFLASAIRGNTFHDCFRSARNAIAALRIPAQEPQLPWLDDDGDAAYSPKDGEVARRRVFGNLPAFGFLIPEIVDARATETLSQAEDFEIWCEMGPGEVERVQAVVSYSGAYYPEGVPVTNMTTCSLTREGATNRWSTTIPASDVAGEGIYTILYTATRRDALGTVLPAAPVARALQVGSAPTPIATPTVTPTPPPTPEPGPVRALITSFYQTILGREPEAGAVDSWHHGYFEYAVNFNIDVRFIPREMARLFFLSEEYAARSRANSEFITDCYRVFLNRDPNQTELDNWLGGQWNRSQVMTVFSESEEFANRIAAMYPGLDGNPTRNFVTFMYVGLLDRLVDKEGLEYAAGLFDAAEDKKTLAKQTAREIIASPEFVSKGLTPPDHVARLYRSFLGRFPGDSETNYWTTELNAGRQTTDSLIDLFGESGEFAGILYTRFGWVATPTPTPTPTSSPTPVPPGIAGTWDESDRMSGTAVERDPESYCALVGGAFTLMR
jgi:WD40 repeat protein